MKNIICTYKLLFEERVSKMKINRKNRIVARLMIIAMLVILPTAVINVPEVHAASAPVASGKVNASGGAYLRKAATKKSARVALLSNNTPLSISREVYVTKKKTNAANRWYYVKANGKTGYIRADLVKNIKYGTNAAKISKKVKYRSGAGNSMKKRGTFKKGRSVTVLLAAKAYGSKAVWYKVKTGSATYYVPAGYVKLGKTTRNAAAAAAPATINTTNKNGNNTFTLSGVSYPDRIPEGSPYTLKGTITCNNTITKAEGGVVNSSGKWEILESANVGSKTFNISVIDSKIKFGTLTKGTYTYKVNVEVGGKNYTQINRSFQVLETKNATKITNKAFELAWPAGTSSKTYSYGSGKATAAFASAIAQAYPNRSSWGAAPKVGASCDVFVGTVLRASGVDGSAPRGLDEQIPYYASSSKYTRVSYSGNQSTLRSGDIIIFTRNSGNTHTCIYLEKNGKAYIAEANYTHTYGMIVDSASSINSKLKTSDKKRMYVYRIKE